MYYPGYMTGHYLDSRARGFYPQPYVPLSFPYRPSAPAPLPLRTPELTMGSAELLQHPHPQHQNIIHHQLSQSQHHHHPPTPIFQNMTAPMQSTEDLAELQKLSNEYEPEAKGPPVGVRQSTSAIAAEYAAADAVYRALPQKYSHYRTIRGDAIAFGYFEALLRHGDHAKFLEEETRLRSLSNLINLAGYDHTMLDDFADETYDLLRKCRGWINVPNAEDKLVHAFNDEGVQNSIITHLKHMTAAWMKTRPDEYAPYLLPYTVDNYCDLYIVTHRPEIDHPGISALTDVLLKPAAIALSIMYLDRSAGSEVNIHDFAPGLIAIATIFLLYRPGHYDLLYNYEDANDVLLTQSHQVAAPTYLQYAAQYAEPFMEIGVPDVMTLLPGMSLVPNQASWMSGSFYGAPEYPAATPLPAQHHTTPPVQHHTTPPVQHHPVPHIVGVMPPYCQPVPVTMAMPAPAPVNSPFHSENSDHSLFDNSSMFRGSEQMYTNRSEIAASTGYANQTSQFKNSHFNTSHFNNPEFHPDEYDPALNFILPANSRYRPKKND
ncbi:hypothetical protein MBLNU459_g2441t1 [Dothideomycetes sp. NU459]